MPGTQNGNKSSKTPTEGQEMGTFLASFGLIRKEIPKDGACLFRAVSEQIYGTQEHHKHVRKICIDTLKKHEESFKSFIHDIPFDHYVEEMSKPSAWGGHVELAALSLFFSVNFKLYATPNQVININTTFPKTLLLCYIGGNHYDNVYTLEQWNLMQTFQLFIYNIAKNALPELEIDVPTTYKNIGLEEWKRGGTSVRSSNLAFSKKLQNQDKKLSGHYRKTTQQTKKQIDQSNKTNTKRTQNKKPKNQNIIPASYKNGSVIPEVRETIVDVVLTEEMINTEEFFPSLSSKPSLAPTPKIVSTVTPGAWGKPKNWSAPVLPKIDETEPVVDKNEKKEAESVPTLTVNTNEEETEKDEEEGIIEEVMKGCVPLGRFSVEEIRDIIKHPISDVKINYTLTTRCVLEEVSGPVIEDVSQVETTGFIPTDTQEETAILANNQPTFSPSSHASMIPPYFPSYPGYYPSGPNAEVFYYPVYPTYVAHQPWYPHN